MKLKREDQFVLELIEELYNNEHITFEQGDAMLKCFIDAGKANILDAEVWALRSALEDVMVTSDAGQPHSLIYEIAAAGLKTGNEFRSFLSVPIDFVYDRPDSTVPDTDLRDIPLGASLIDSDEAKTVFERFRNLR